MLSRVADSVYWLSRYVERAENVARFIDVNYNLTLGEGNRFGDNWASLIYTTGDHTEYEKHYGPAHEATQNTVLSFLLFDERNPNSILSCVASARENARAIREIIPSVVWEQLNKFYFLVRSEAKKERVISHPQEFCQLVRLAGHTLVGATDTTMSHGEAWHFSRIGRYIERADKTSRIVDVQYYLLLPNVTDVGTTIDSIRWTALLKSTSSLEMYRRQHGKIEPDLVADFLILDREFPRAMQFCLIESLASLRKITCSQPGTFCNRSEQLLGQLSSNMNYLNIANIIAFGLHEYIDEFQNQLNEIGVAIGEDFFRAFVEPPAPAPIDSAFAPTQFQNSATNNVSQSSNASQTQTQSQSQSHP